MTKIAMAKEIVALGYSDKSANTLRKLPYDLLASMHTSAIMQGEKAMIQCECGPTLEEAHNY